MNGALIDLHTHSTCSDGSLEPAELVSAAAAAGIEVLALTDHDTTAGLAEAQRAADRHGVRLVAGVEISASWRAQDIHVLGLWIDSEDAALRRLLAAQQELRRSRLTQICARLSRLKLPGAELLAAATAQGGVPTRAHLARSLVSAGHAATAQAAFRKYLGFGKAAYVAPEWPALATVVSCIGAAGGAAVLAHPARYGLSSRARARLLADFSAAGGSALEVISGPNAAQHGDGLVKLALAHGLTGSVGSDFHNHQAAWNPLGRSLKLPDCLAPVWRSFGL